MTDSPPPPPQLQLTWSTQLSSLPSSKSPITLTGDNILLPQSALEQLLSAAAAAVSSSSPVSSATTIPAVRGKVAAGEQALPRPLVFRLYNPANNRFTHAVPREFSAEEGEVVLSEFLREALGITDDDGPRVASTSDFTTTTAAAAAAATVGGGGGEGTQKLTIVSKSLPKGTYVRLRPLEAGYDDEDWKALLERHLRMNFTTLTMGEILAVSGRTVGHEVGGGGRGKSGDFRFLIDKLEPEEAVCILDTDLEVDIEPLSEEQARETLKRRLARENGGGGGGGGGVLKVDQEAAGVVLPGDYHFYEVGAWDRALPVVVELDGVGEGEEVDVFISSDKQHHKPRMDEHVWGEFASEYPKRIQISSTNVEFVDAKTLFIGIHGYRPLDASPFSFEEGYSEDDSGRPYTLRVTQSSAVAASLDDSLNSDSNTPPSPDSQKCGNCSQWIPQRTFVLHENFCLRNNIVCKSCGQVSKKGTEQNHWHCPSCTTHGNNAPSGLIKHTSVIHTRRNCPACPYEATNLPDLAVHRTTTCPGKTILCKFCHLLLPQEGDHDGSQPTAEILLTGLSKHELSCGARTSNCHLCTRIVRLRDMDTHMKTHTLQRLSKPTPKICRNQNCCRTTTTSTNELNLCTICFGPLYAPGYDPTGAALKRRVERKFLSQLLKGCGKEWCKNRMCKTGLSNSSPSSSSNEKQQQAEEGEEEVVITTATAAPLLKPIMEKLLDPSVGLGFCVDETTQKRRLLAEALVAESECDHHDERVGGYAIGWTVAAVEDAAGSWEGARAWLEREGVRRGER